MPNSSQAAHSGTDTAVSTPSTGKHVKTEEKKSRLLHILPKLPSTDSLSNSPGPSSPGAYILKFSFRKNHTNCFRYHFNH